MARKAPDTVEMLQRLVALQEKLEATLELAGRAAAEASRAHARLDQAGRYYRGLAAQVDMLGCDVRELAHEHEALARS